MKRCSRCDLNKPLAEFYPKSGRVNQWFPWCKECDKKRRSERYREHREEELAVKQAYDRSHPELRKRISKGYYWRNRSRALSVNREYHQNRDRANDRHQRWASLNKYKIRSITARKRAALKMATPVWADRAAIDAIYKQAILRERETGQKHHVDHIVPLQSPLVCGLHVQHNLQVIPSTENLSKGNRVWPGMP